MERTKGKEALYLKAQKLAETTTNSKVSKLAVFQNAVRMIISYNRLTKKSGSKNLNLGNLKPLKATRFYSAPALSSSSTDMPALMENAVDSDADVDDDVILDH